MEHQTEVAIIGAGVGGLVLALSLHQAGIACRVYESVEEIRPLGVGINLLPHATKELDELGLLPILDPIAVKTRESIFFNRYGQFIYSEPRSAEHTSELQSLMRTSYAVFCLKKNKS